MSNLPTWISGLAVRCRSEESGVAQAQFLIHEFDEFNGPIQLGHMIGILGLTPNPGRLAIR